MSLDPLWSSLLSPGPLSSHLLMALGHHHLERPGPSSKLCKDSFQHIETADAPHRAWLPNPASRPAPPHSSACQEAARDLFIRTFPGTTDTE